VNDTGTLLSMLESKGNPRDIKVTKLLNQPELGYTALQVNPTMTF
jgi:hypothetical protein